MMGMKRAKTGKAKYEPSALFTPSVVVAIF